MNTARQSPDHITEASQLMYGTGVKRSADMQPSYMQLMLERQGPKRMKTEHTTPNVSSGKTTEFC